MGKLITLIVAASFGVLGAGLAALNTGTVTLHYYYGTWDIPLALLVGACIALGMFMGLLVNAITVLRLKRQIAKRDRAAAQQHQAESPARLVPIKPW